MKFMEQSLIVTDIFRTKRIDGVTTTNGDLLPYTKITVPKALKSGRS